MEHIAHAAPVVKWVGGKRQLLPQILPLIPKRMTAYCEPFLGGGAVLFALQPRRALVNDLNQDLITVYRVIREDADALIEHLSRHENTPEYFYRIRDLDRDKDAYAALSDVEKASRLLYLNKTCYNGLFRVNASGSFNSPYGHYRRPNIVNEQTIRGVSRYFNSCDITFFSGDFAAVLEQVPEGGERCFRCYRLRLEEAAQMARAGGFDYFTTTLSISPLKNAEKLNEIGAYLAEEYKVPYLFSDFKKRNGYKRSTELSAEYGLYRQDYCGCVFSLRERKRAGERT